MSVGMVFVDTWVLSSAFPFGNVTEKAWKDLERTLEIAPKVFDYIIVVGNRPVYSSGSSKGDSTLQYYLQPLLKKAGVDAYISGYDRDMEVIEVRHLSASIYTMHACSIPAQTSGPDHCFHVWLSVCFGVRMMRLFLLHSPGSEVQHTIMKDELYKHLTVLPLQHHLFPRISVCLHSFRTTISPTSTVVRDPSLAVRLS